MRRRVEKKWDGTGGRGEQARGRGGFGTERRGSFNGLGRLVELPLTPGRASDVGQAEARLADHAPGAVIADRGSDKKALVEAVESRGAAAVIPPRRNRAGPRAIDPHLYRERNECARFWAKAEPFRRVATRSDKKAANDLAFARLAAAVVALK